MIRVKNITKGKPIGFAGKLNILPGEVIEVADDYKNNASLKTYIKCGFVTVEEIKEEKEEAEGAEETAEEPAAEDKQKPKRGSKKPTKAEQLRLSRLASLDNISDTDLAVLADQLEIQAKDCFDVADMKAKVRAALEK